MAGRITARITIALCLGVVSGCSALDHTPMEFTVSGKSIIANGDIDGGTMQRFNAAQASAPQAKTLVLQTVGGSVDDDANLAFSQQIRAQAFATHVPSDGLIASGGTDLFLAGVIRTVAPDACVGVHSWAGGGVEGKDVPRDAPEHAKYLTYYRAMGIPADFYWYTLQAAPADGMHWMDAGEMNRYAMTTAPAPVLGSTIACENR